MPRKSSKGHHFRNNKLHREIKEERGYRCELCGIVPGDLQKRAYWGAVPEPLKSRDFWVHHIDDDPWNDDINNLVVVCPRCHGRPKYFFIRPKAYGPVSWFRWFYLLAPGRDPTIDVNLYQYEAPRHDQDSEYYDEF